MSVHETLSELAYRVRYAGWAVAATLDAVEGLDPSPAPVRLGAETAAGDPWVGARAAAADLGVAVQVEALLDEVAALVPLAEPTSDAARTLAGLPDRVRVLLGFAHVARRAGGDPGPELAAQLAAIRAALGTLAQGLAGEAMAGLVVEGSVPLRMGTTATFAGSPAVTL